MTELAHDKKYLKPLDYASFGGAMFANGAVTGLLQAYLMTFSLLIIPDDKKYVLGIIFFIVKVWDGINDPILGLIVDRTKTKWGKMRPYIIFAAIPFGLLTIAFFVIPNSFSTTAKLVLIFLLYLLWDTVSTLVDVPLNGLYAVITPNSKERTKLVTFTRLLGSVGGESALVLYTIALLIMGKDKVRESITVAAVIIGVLAPLLLMWGAMQSKERLAPPIQEKHSIKDVFKYLKQNKPLIFLLLANLLTFFRHVVSASIIYMVVIVFNEPQKQILFAIPGAIASVLGMLLAPVMKKKFDSKKIFIISTIAHSAALVLVYVVGSAVMSANMQAALYVIAALAFFSMLPVGLLNTVPTLMATDIIDYMELKTGKRYEGITFSLMTLRSKISSGLKDAWMIFLLVVVFKLVGDTTSSTFPPQSNWTKKGIFWMYTLIPAATNLLSIVPLFWYKLDGKTMEKVHSELDKKRAEKTSETEVLSSETSDIIKNEYLGEKKMITIAIIGLGSRGYMYARHLKSQGATIVSICEKKPTLLETSAKTLGVEPDKAFLDEKDFFAQGKIADAMVIATQDRDHYGHAKQALELGYHILCEKPVSPIKEQCEELNELAIAKNLHMVVCHVLRYTAFYDTIKKIIDSGLIGEITNVNLVENIGYFHFAHSYVRGNWRREDETGPSILAKCCHDLDMIYYLTGKKAKTVYSAGYRKAFLPENAPEGAPSHCLSGCPEEKTCPYHVDRIYLTPKKHSFPFMMTKRRLICEKPKATRKEFKETLKTSSYGRCVYKCDNDVMENQVVSLKLEGDIPATLNMTCHSNRVFRHARISGTKGEIVGEGGKFKLKIFAGPKKTYRFNFLEAISHATGDVNIIKDFLKLLRTGEMEPRLSLMKDTMESHLVAFAAEESRKTNKIIEMPEY